jgi:hypothetical protein
VDQIESTSSSSQYVLFHDEQGPSLDFLSIRSRGRGAGTVYCLPHASCYLLSNVCSLRGCSCCLQPAICSVLPTVLCSLLSLVCCRLLSTVLCLMSILCFLLYPVSLLFFLRCSLHAACCLPSIVCRFLSAVCSLLFLVFVCCLLSSVCCMLSSIYSMLSALSLL